MRDMNLKNNCKRAAGLGLIAAGALMASQAAMACQTSAWSTPDGGPGSVTAGDPTGGISRYSGFCGMQTADGQVSYVADESPGGIDRIRARFYVKLDNDVDDAVFFQARDAGGGIFLLEADTNGEITLQGASSPITAPGRPGFWNSVEVDWDPNGGGATLTVGFGDNTPTGGDTLVPAGPQNASISQAAPIESVRLGNLDGVTGTFSFDAYESRRTEAIGPLVRGDGDGNGIIGGGDISTILTEFTGAGLASGQVDCDENGVVGGGDISCVLNLFLGNYDF